MTKITVDNDVISITLAGNESTTVPTGEVWDVTISVGSAATLEINGEGISDDSNKSIETTVKDGDTLAESDGTNDGIHIGGYEVSP